jgi:hypothetical protein
MDGVPPVSPSILLTRISANNRPAGRLLHLELGINRAAFNKRIRFYSRHQMQGRLRLPSRVGSETFIRSTMTATSSRCSSLNGTTTVSNPPWAPLGASLARLGQTLPHWLPFLKTSPEPPGAAVWALKRVGDGHPGRGCVVVGRGAAIGRTNGVHRHHGDVTRSRRIRRCRRHLTLPAAAVPRRCGRSPPLPSPSVQQSVPVSVSSF